MRRRQNRRAARQLPRQLGIEADGVELADEGIERPHPGTKNNERPLVFPGHDEVVRSHSVGNIVPAQGRAGGEALRHAAIAGHDVNLGVAVILGSEGELLAIGREARERAVAGTTRQATGDAALFPDGVKFARVTKDNLVPVGRWKTQETRGFRERLGRGETERQETGGQEQE